MCNQTRQSVALICLIGLFSISSGMADSADPADNTATNGTVIIPGAVEQSDGPHTLDAIDTNDWFRIVFTAGIPCQLETIGESDTKAFLYEDPDEITQLAEDDQSGLNDNFRIRYLPTVTATNYLKVQSFPAGFNATYTLRYSIYSADEWDPVDNTFTNATVLTMGEAAKVQGPHKVDEYYYDFWYTVHLATGQLYRFESLGSDDTKAFLYLDPTAGDIANNDDGLVDFNFRLDYEPAVSADYYLQVQEYGGGAASYDLRYYIPATDSDADQLPDLWEQHYFGSTNSMPDDLTGDSDAFNNLQEYIAGTDPTDSSSLFAVTNWSPGSFVVEWPAFPSRQYQVYRADSLTNIFNPVGSVILYPTNSYTDTENDAEDSGFYKVEVQLQ